MSKQKTNWNQVKLQDICTVVAGSSFPIKYQGVVDQPIPFIKVSDMNLPGNHKYVGKSINTVSRDSLKVMRGKTFPEGTVIFPKVGAALLTNKRRILAGEATFDNNIMGLIPKSVDTEYLYQLMLTIDFAKYAGNGAVPSINQSFIQNFLVALPSSNVQKKIGVILNEVDQSIEKTDQIIQKAEQLKYALMVDLFAVDRSIQKKKLEDVLELSQYGLSIKSAPSGQYPMFRMNNFEAGKMIPFPLVYVDLDNATFLKYRLDKGDILFNRTNSHELVGKTGMFELDGDYVFASYLVRLRANRKIMNPYYLNYYMNSPYGKNQIEYLKARGVSQSNINPTALRSRFLCPTPPLDHQEKVITVLQSVDKKIISEKQARNSLLKLKQGLMHDIFSRKVEVN